jgi:hypothetical protein
VDCGTYIENFLSAHADGELAGDELRTAEAHVRECAQCRARLAEERELKRMLHRQLANVELPAQLRARMHRALEAAQAEESRSSVRRLGGIARLRQPQVWVPSAIAAMLLIGLTTWRLTTPEVETPSESQQASSIETVPMFEMAIHHLDRFDRGFVPNVPSASPREISDAYMGHKMPGILWNFGPAGYQMIGGRVEQLSDGQTATFTYYRGDHDSILCTYMPAPALLPVGAVHETDSRTWYSYKGYSICVSNYTRGGFICILTSRQPMADFMQLVSAFYS